MVWVAGLTGDGGKGMGRWRRMEVGMRNREWKATCIARLAGKGHQVVLVEGAGLIVGGFEDGCTAHGGFGGGDDGEVFTGDS